MADIHIEDFCQDVARILIQLYNNFPRPTDVYVEDIAGDDQKDEFGLHSNRHLACFGAMLWLADEGFLRYVTTIGQEAIDQATLTHRAFTLRCRVCSDQRLLFNDVAMDESELRDLPPDVASERKTTINLLKEVLATGSSTRINRVVQHLILSPQSKATG